MIYRKSLEMKKKKKNKKKYAEEIKANFIVKSNIRKIVREEQNKGQGEITVYTTNVFSVDGKELKKETTKEVIKIINKSTSSYSKSKGKLPGMLSYAY